MLLHRTAGCPSLMSGQLKMSGLEPAYVCTAQLLSLTSSPMNSNPALAECRESHSWPHPAAQPLCQGQSWV
jgi:hypothetical protein